MSDHEILTFSSGCVRLIRLQQFARLGSLIFLVVCVVVQVCQPNRPLATPLSHYLTGPFAVGMHIAFVVFAVAMILFGLSLRGLVARRAAGAARLFYISALSLCVTALSAGPPLLGPPPEPELAYTVHVFSASLAFVAGLLGMAALTHVVWRHPLLDHMRGLVAALIFGCFLALVLDPCLTGVHGALEKLTIVGMIAWQLIVTRRLIAACEAGMPPVADISPPDG